MALTFPLALSAFADLLPIATVSWSLDVIAEVSGTGGGSVIVREYGPRKWRAEVALDRMILRDAARVQAIVEGLGASGAFLLSNPALPGPAYDPLGTILGAAAPQINAIATDRTRIKLDNLPNGYVLTPGDLFSYTHTSGTRRALHRVVEAATASSGVTGYFTVAPPIPAAAATGTVVTLVKPRAAMLLAPGGFRPGTADSTTVTGMGFTAIEAS